MKERAGHTQRHEHLEAQTISYIVNAGFSEYAINQIVPIQKQLKDKFGDVIWCMPPESLHITLMDWIAPLVDYGKNQDSLYSDIFDEYSNALEDTLSRFQPIELHFNTITASPTTIFIQASNDNVLNEIRFSFLEKIALMPGTKPPPNITHSSICRFTQRQDLAPIKNYVSELKIDFTETIHSFRIVRESKLPMLEFKVIGTYEMS